MKWVGIVAFASLLIPVTAGAREFTSADGTKKMEAEFVRYDFHRKNVTLLLANGRRMVVPVSTFSEADNTYFLEAQRKVDAKSAFKVTVETDDTREKIPRGLVIVSKESSNFLFKVENLSSSEFENLEVRYWVVIQREKEGEDEIEILDGKGNLPDLSGASVGVVEGPTVELTKGGGANCQSSCPKAKQAAAQAAGKIGRDRILGTKVEVRDGKGELLFEDVSSKRVAALLEEGGTDT